MNRSVRRAILRFSIHNRRRKAAMIGRFIREAGIRTVLVVGTGGGTEPNELVVERAVESDATIVAALDLWSAVTITWPYVQGDGRGLPFRDRGVDLVLSQAVIEHVGDGAQQERFLAEHRRVGRWWLTTTPNRWFPVEPHTGAVMRHWSRRWRSRRDEFTRLLSRSEFEALTPDATVRVGRRFSPTFLAAGLSGDPPKGRPGPRPPGPMNQPGVRSGTTTTTARTRGRSEGAPRES
jgi:hypothetical protein